MIAGQKLYSQDVEVLLFPMDCMYITQGEHGSISHDLAMDFVGWNGSSQINHYPYYAPCTVICVQKNYSSGQAYVIYESLNQVYCADGNTRYINFVVMHDENPLYNVGDIIPQGNILGHTGAEGFATGDHLHLNIADGKYSGWHNVGGQFYELNNSVSIYDLMFVNDTILYLDYGYNWKIYEGGITPPISREKKKFPWVLYARKFRNRNNLR